MDKERDAPSPTPHRAGAKKHGGVTVYLPAALREAGERRGIAVNSATFVRLFRAYVAGINPQCEGCADRRLVAIMKRELASTHPSHSSTAASSDAVRMGGILSSAARQ